MLNKIWIPKSRLLNMVKDMTYVVDLVGYPTLIQGQSRMSFRYFYYYKKYYINIVIEIYF